MAKAGSSATLEAATPKAAASPFSAEEIASFKETLVAERKKILAFYQHDMAAGKENHADEPEDFADRANMSYNRELMFSLSDAEEKQMAEIDAALGRIEAGIFGICLYSGKPISAQRLKIVPWARYRVEYQEMAEKGMLGDDS